MRVEPIGYKAPSLSSNAESITFKHAIGRSFGLLCQAQAFPVPVFRYDTLPTNITQEQEKYQHTLSQKDTQQIMPLIFYALFKPIKLLIVFTEPVGSVAPKIAGDRLQESVVCRSQTLSILCLGQSYPVPSFRYTFKNNQFANRVLS